MRIIQIDLVIYTMSLETLSQHFPKGTPEAAALFLKVARVEDGQHLAQYLQTVDTQEKVWQQKPLSVEMIAPPTGCAQDCVYCSAGARSAQTKDEIKLFGRKVTSIEHKRNTVQAVVDELAGMGTRGAIWSGGGDWCVYPWITEVIEHAYNQGFENNFWISHFAAREFSPEEAERAVTCCTSIRASVDAADIDTYNEIRRPLNNNAFHIMKKNVQSFVEARSRTSSDTRIGIQMLLLPINISKIEEMFALAQELGVDYIQLRPVEPTGERYNEQGQPVGIHSYDQFYTDLGIFDHVAAQCAEYEVKYGIKALYREDKVEDIKETGLEQKPTRPAEYCDGSLFQAVVQFDLPFKEPKLLHCYYRDDLAIPFNPGQLGDVLYSPERQACAECANATPDRCSAGCKYVTSGLNMAMGELRKMSPTQQVITIEELLHQTKDVKLLDPHII